MIHLSTNGWGQNLKIKLHQWLCSSAVYDHEHLVFNSMVTTTYTNPVSPVQMTPVHKTQPLEGDPQPGNPEEPSLNCKNWQLALPPS